MFLNLRHRMYSSWVVVPAGDLLHELPLGGVSRHMPTIPAGAPDATILIDAKTVGNASFSAGIDLTLRLEISPLSSS
ncbi:MAG: hypothetical protein V3V46_08510 [Anaerolineales bacterium]